MSALLSVGAFRDLEVNEIVLEAAALLLEQDESNQRKAVEILEIMFRPEN